MSDTPADWYPDPWGRSEFRYWDGATWTDQVASHGVTSTDVVDGIAPKTVTGAQSSDKVQRQVDRHFVTSERKGAAVDRDAVASGGLLDQPVLVVNQKAKLIEVNSEYAVYDRDGRQIGAVRQVGQSKLKKIVRFVGSLDQYFTHKLQVVDASNQIVLGLTRPAKFIKSRVIVNDDTGAEIGVITQNNVFGKISFDISADGAVIGKIQAENWRAWNFRIEDGSGTEVARITKTFEGVLKTAFTTADNYVVQIHRPLSDPMRQMVVAAALTVDTALKQDSRGFSPMDALDFG